MVRILAFDTGTANTGWALLIGDVSAKQVRLSDFGMIKTKKTDEHTVRERIDFIGAEVSKLIQELRPTHMAIEDFTEQGKFVGKTYKEMAWLTEHFRIVARNEGLPLSIYENGEWKKHTLKAARANKEQAKHYISHKLPETRELLAKAPTHVWDSVGIGYCQWLLLL